MEMNEEKKADNQIYTNRIQISNVENQIDYNKSKMKTLSDMEEGFVSLSKNIEKCVELLSQSMKGNNIERKLGDISDNNKMYLKNIVSTIDDEKVDTNKELKNLYDRKDELEKEQKRMFREQDEKEHEYDSEPKVQRNTEVETLETNEVKEDKEY